MIFLALLLIVIGVVMLLKPDIIWQISESWKSADATEPSSLYIFSTRFGGVMFVLAGLAYIVVMWIA